MIGSVEQIKKYVRAANYLTAAQIYLQDNVLGARPLVFTDIKPRLLGHWGTSPGINFVYANLNWLIKKHGQEMLFVLGPGHGFPALQANLFLEGTLEKFYPEAAATERGIRYLAKNFSWPYGFPSHANPGTPGVILEGGELGYSLSTASGAVLDNPDLIAVCLVGDGEAETGPTATAWHLHKFIDPAANGVVLPILHLNGYKISGPTIFGRMTNADLKALFTGYGYEPHIVEGDGDAVYKIMANTLEACYASITKIQEKARSGVQVPPGGWRLPMIVLKTPKGWTGIKELHGQKIEGNCLAHQVVATNAKTDREELSAVSDWLKSYKFEELFNEEDGGFCADIKSIVPPPELRMGMSKHTFGGKAVTPLELPSAEQFSEDASVPGTIGSSSMRRAGLFLEEVFKRNAARRNFRLMSPDETYSNKLDAVFSETSRAFVLEKMPWDRDLAPDGRVMEMLSEHSLQGLLQGYVLTGRHGIFASYEAFIQIVGSMADQYLKFLKGASEVSWRGAIPSLNYILTSSGWRQEHNGFSHQNPGFIGSLLQKPGCFVKVYFPPDGNSTLTVLKHTLESRNRINVIVAGKTLEPRWLTPALADKEFATGIMTWEFASDKNPDIVFAAAGDYLTKEALAALDIVKREAPEIKARFVNVMELSVLGFGNDECRVPVNLNDYFTESRPVIFNFHGYPQVVKQALFEKGYDERFSVHGYIENGSTTTPFDMQVRNETSRWHLAVEAFGLMAKNGVLGATKAEVLAVKYRAKLAEHDKYIREFGADMPEVENWQWKK